MSPKETSPQRLADVLKRDGAVRAACAAVAAEFLLVAAGSGGDRCSCDGDINEPNEPLPMRDARARSESLLNFIEQDQMNVFSLSLPSTTLHSREKDPR